MQRIFIKKCFLFTMGSVCRAKGMATGSRNSLKDEEVETGARKWLTRQYKDFCAEVSTCW
jgi:hypothetical protein